MQVGGWIRELKRRRKWTYLMALHSIKGTKAEEILSRLDVSSAAVEGYYAQWHDELEVRDQIILEAVREGVPWSTVALSGRVSQPRVNQIIAKRWPREAPAGSAQEGPETDHGHEPDQD
jgi:hypothetical protein